VIKITQPVVKELKLNEFQVLYKTWKTNVIWLDHLLLGLLVWLEQKLIDNRIKTDLDTAIEQYDTLLPPPPSPVYTETPSKTSTRLPEMRITSAWYVDKVSERSEPPEGI
jgi:hypothetical protein